MIRWCATLPLCGLALATSLSDDANRLMRRHPAPTMARRQWEISEAGSVVAPHNHRGVADNSEYHVVLTPGALIDKGAQHLSWEVPDILESSSASGSSSPARELMKRSKLSSLLALKSSDPVFTSIRSRESRSDEGSFTVSCKRGYTCVGGGCLARLETDFVVSERDPTGRGWRCISGDDATDKTKKVWAVCALSCAAFNGTCEGDRVDDLHHICGHETCTAAECCKSAPTCESYTDQCPGDTIKKSDDTACSTTDCSADDCCTIPQKCTEWEGQCECGGGNDIQIPNFEHFACAGVTCTADECCEDAPTCASFEDPSCTGTKNADASCCSGTCSCEHCYSRGR